MLPPCSFYQQLLGELLFKYPVPIAQTTCAGRQPMASLNPRGLGFRSWGHPVTFWFLRIWTSGPPWPLKVCRAVGDPRHSAAWRTEREVCLLRKLMFPWFVITMSYKALPCISFHWCSKHNCLCSSLCFQTPSREPWVVILRLHHLLTHLYAYTAPLHRNGAIGALLFGREGAVRVTAGVADWRAGQ